jgi:tetratricopeptide (TPR) repeat protein
MPDFARRVHDAIDVLRVLLESGQAEAVVALAERALDRADKASARVDDSDGYLGGIAADLAELHLAACRMTRPDSVELARRLYGWARHGGDLRSLTADVERYQDVLGEAGVAEYRRLAEADWVNVPVLRAGDNDAVDGDRFRITAIMESLAEASGDIDAIVSVYARDQSTVYRLLRIADVYRAAGRHADARQWLEKAINAFGAVDPRLIDTLAEEYHYAGRAADAVSLCWRAYESQPTPENYRRLRANATAAGVWAHWHEHAMATLRRRVAARIAAGPQPSGYPLPGLAGFVTQPDASALVSVLLYEDDVEQAWVEAQAGGCSEALWADLAARREADHPADAIPIWQRHAERAIAIGSNQGYEEAVAMMARVRRLMSSAATPDAFVSYIAGIRLAYHRKRNLMKLLDQRGW